MINNDAAHFVVILYFAKLKVQQTNRLTLQYVATGGTERGISSELRNL
jgi:hypothetical protein